MMTIEERLEAIEKQLYLRKLRSRWLLCVGASCVVAALVFGFILGRSAEAGAEKDEIRARRFTLVDVEGIRRADLKMVGGEGSFGSPKLEMYDARGNVQISLEGGIYPQLTLFTPTFSDPSVKEKKSYICLNAAPGMPGLTIYDNKERMRVYLSLYGEGSLRQLRDHQGKPFIGADEGKPMLVMYDAADKVLWQTP